MLSNLADHTTPEAQLLKTSCQANLASCFLQLQNWSRCIEMCNKVLLNDKNNRKALYRRGQARLALGKTPAEAVADIQRAIELSPEAEHDVMQPKLLEAQQAAKLHAKHGIIIEEVHSDDDDGTAHALKKTIVVFAFPSSFMRVDASRE